MTFYVGVFMTIFSNQNKVHSVFMLSVYMTANIFKNLCPLLQWNNRMRYYVHNKVMRHDGIHFIYNNDYILPRQRWWRVMQSVLLMINSFAQYFNFSGTILCCLVIKYKNNVSVGKGLIRLNNVDMGFDIYEYWFNQ